MDKFRVVFMLSYLSFGSLASWAQTGASAALVRVSGTVSDASTKHVLPGVAVRLRHPRQGVVTNTQGDFLLTAAPTDTLLFQAVGYKPYRLLLPGSPLSQPVVLVRLQHDSIHLREVQVTADHVDQTSVNRALRNASHLLLQQPRPFTIYKKTMNGNAFYLVTTSV